ncbi:hypothetical protein B7463_g4280, partial [Scytalidium lignicola]
MASVSRVSTLTKRSTICAQCLRNVNSSRTFTTRTFQAAVSKRHTAPNPLFRPSPFSSQFLQQQQNRLFANPTSASLTADEILEGIQEQYATARDEFEIATEETEKKTVYAADDRAAARDELQKLKEMFEEALLGTHAEDVKRRVGSRIRELDAAVEELNKADYED